MPDFLMCLCDGDTNLDPHTCIANTLTLEAIFPAQDLSVYVVESIKGSPPQIWYVQYKYG